MNFWTYIHKKPLVTGMFGFSTTLVSWLEFIAGIFQPIGIIAGSILTILSLYAYIKKQFFNTQNKDHA